METQAIVRKNCRFFVCRNTKISAKTMLSTLNVKNFIIAGHENSTRDLCGQPLISINRVITSELNITGRLPEAGNLKPNITRPPPEKTYAAI